MPGWDILIWPATPLVNRCQKTRSRRFSTTLPTIPLEYFRQRLDHQFASRLPALLLFATRVEAVTFRSKHPARVFGKTLARARSQGAYVCCLHDSSWLDYPRLPPGLKPVDS